MGEKEDKEKAEKLAAAKKRVAQLQKKKQKAAGTGDKAGTSSKKSKDVEKESVEDESQTIDKPEATAAEDPSLQVAADTAQEVNDADGASARTRGDDEEVDAEEERSTSPTGVSPSTEPGSAKPRHLGRQPSISMQSKMRSASFRQGAPTSPAADEDFPDIYRKQLAKIDELERENKRLTQEVEQSRARWHKDEDELEGLRERAAENKDTDGNDAELEQLRSEIDTLRRNSRNSVSAPKGMPDADTDSLRKELESKEATISDMQLEISRLRSQVTSLTTSGNDENEQIAALQDSLQRSESLNTKLQTELADVKKALTRASEKAVVDSTERTSKETKIKALERELEGIRTAHKDIDEKRETLEKKIEALNKLHREVEQRNAPKLAQADNMVKELAMTKAKLEATEKDNLKLREARKHHMSGDGAEEGLDEIEDEERKRLEKRIRDLESENFDLRRGVWRDKRREMQPNLSMEQDADGNDFDEVDLNGSGPATRKSSVHPPSQLQQKHSGFSQVLSSGLAAFRASTTSPDSNLRQQSGRPRNDSLLEEFDDDTFDENAFAAAQREEEMKKMVEHVREVKKGLRQWQGWRLDLVDLRRSGGGGPGFGEMFEV